MSKALRSVTEFLTARSCAWLLGCAPLCAAIVFAADPQPYEVELTSTGNPAIDGTLKASSQLETLRKGAPVSPIGLIARARGDMKRLKTVLESYGYYSSVVTMTIDGLALEDDSLGDDLMARPEDSPATIKVSFETGPLYRVGRIDIDGTVPEELRRSMLLYPGAPAVASDVLGAGARLLTALQDSGYAFARVDPPIAYEDPDHSLLNLSFHVVTGERVMVGELHFQGLKNLRETALRRRLHLRTGDTYSAAQVEQARKYLLGLGVFGTVSAQLGEADAEGRVPITFQVRERKRHAVSVNAAYSSDLGVSGGVQWINRNLSGYADQLTFSATLLDLGGGTATTGLGYDTSIRYRLQDVGVRNQSLQFSLGAIRQSLRAYDQTATIAGITLDRRLSSIWSGSISISGTHEAITQETLVSGASTPSGATSVRERNIYNLLALPISVLYDTTDLASPLLDPTHGIRASASMAPTVSFGSSNALFLITQASIAGYIDLDKLLGIDPGRSVLALRVMGGIAQGAGTFSLPPDQRFYVGGSGTVRGYRYQSVGPQFADGNPIGGTAFNAANIELRQRIGRNLGFVVFVDGGRVSGSLIPFSDTFQVGAGAGARVYTPIGALRLDLAVPVNRRATDDSFEVYVGLGQAF